MRRNWNWAEVSQLLSFVLQVSWRAALSLAIIVSLTVLFSDFLFDQPGYSVAPPEGGVAESRPSPAEPIPDRGPEDHLAGTAASETQSADQLAPDVFAEFTTATNDGAQALSGSAGTLRMERNDNPGAVDQSSAALTGVAKSQMTKEENESVDLGAEQRVVAERKNVPDRKPLIDKRKVAKATGRRCGAARNQETKPGTCVELMRAVLGGGRDGLSGGRGTGQNIRESGSGDGQVSTDQGRRVKKISQLGGPRRDGSVKAMAPEKTAGRGNDEIGAVKALEADRRGALADGGLGTGGGRSEGGSGSGAASGGSGSSSGVGGGVSVGIDAGGISADVDVSVAVGGALRSRLWLPAAWIQTERVRKMDWSW